MGEEKQTVDMRYEGDRKQHDKLECIFSYNGKEYRLMYHQMAVFANLYSLPEEVREYILFWAKMLNNPD